MKLKLNLIDQFSKTDKLFKDETLSEFRIPVYDPGSHYLELTKSKYYWALLTLRHYLKASSDQYFSVDVGATNIDLFMMTPSVSSPMRSAMRKSQVFLIAQFLKSGTAKPAEKKAHFFVTDN